MEKKKNNFVFETAAFLFFRLKEIIFLYSAHKIRSYAKKSAYIKMLRKNIPVRGIETVIECGARDLRDAFAIKLCYRPKKIYAFEANPAALPICAKTLKKYWMFRDGIDLIPKAVWDKNTAIRFYSVQSTASNGSDQKSNLNIGSSSCFKPPAPETKEVTHEEVEVEAVRLDSFCAQRQITAIDLLCMDIEGAEYNALIGLGDYLDHVNYIITELMVKPDKEGKVQYKVVESLLKSKGFVVVDSLKENPDMSNFLFARKKP